MPIQIDYTFLNNGTIILDCLPTSDFQTARRLYEDMIHIDSGINYRKIDSVNTLLEVFAKLKEDCINGMLPIIHIEAHGDSNLGIQIGDKREDFPWENLVNVLREINIETKNNTGVILAACEGLYAIRQVSIFKPTPFAFVIGSQEKVSAGDFDAQMRRFYQSLVDSKSVAIAMNEVPKTMQLFHSEQFFLIAIGKHFKQYMGARFLPNVEKMLSSALEIHKDHPVWVVREKLKTELKPSKRRFLEYANLFLHGKITITYEEFMEFLRGKKRNQNIGQSS